MRRINSVLLTTALMVLFVASMSHAAIIGYVWQNESTAAHNPTIDRATVLGTADAMFDVVNAFSYDSRDSATNSLSAFLDNPAFYNTSASFNPNAIIDNTYFLFIGDMYLNAGVNNFTVNHDDGLQLAIDGISGLVVDAASPTAPVTTPFTVSVATAGFYNFSLSYGECDGLPGVLELTLNNAPVVTNNPVPEPATIMLIGFGLLGLAGFRKIKK